MALKSCKECGHQVSDKADSCPQCGAKIKKGLPRWVVWIVFIFVFAAIIGSCQDKSDSRVNNGGGNSALSQSSTDSAQINNTPKNWSYERSKDEMRGTKSSTAYTVSKNKVDFAFPYRSKALNFLATYFDVIDRNKNKPERRYLEFKGIALGGFEYLHLKDWQSKHLVPKEPFVMDGKTYDAYTGATNMIRKGSVEELDEIFG